MANFKSCRSDFKLSVKTLSIVIPAHNEEKTISEFVSSLSLAMIRISGSGFLFDYEIIVLDDGSTDKTSSILREIAHEKTRVIFNSSASGIHRAFLQLYSEACMEWILLVPGDAQWPASEIERLVLYHFKTSPIIPTMTTRRHKTGYSPVRLFVSSCFGNFAKYFLKSFKQADPGSIKILPREVASLNYICNSVLIEIERMMYCEENFGKLNQLEVDIVPRIYGSSSTITLKTLRPLLNDCFKMFIFYKLLRRRLIGRNQVI